MEKLVKIKKTVRLSEVTYNQLREYMVPRGVMRHIDIINILKKSSAAAAHKMFSDEVFEKIEHTKDDWTRFCDLQSVIFDQLVHSGKVIQDTSVNWRLMLNPNQDSIAEPVYITNTHNYHSVGQVIQDSRFEDNAMKMNVTSTPSANENKHSAIIRLILKYWWALIVPIIAGIILIYFEIFANGE